MAIKTDVSSKTLGNFAFNVQRLIFALIKAYERCDRLCTREHAVTVSESYTLLALPENSSITMNQLSKAKDLAGSTMTRVVDGLVRKKLVTRKPDAGDRRVVRVKLTEKGKDLRRVIEKEHEELLGTVLGDTTPDERKTIVSSLDRLVTAINKTLAQYENAEN